MPDVPVGGEEHVESGRLGCVQYLAVPQGIPPMRTGLFDGVIR